MTLNAAVASGKLFKLPKHVDFLTVLNDKIINSKTGAVYNLTLQDATSTDWITKATKASDSVIMTADSTPAGSKLVMFGGLVRIVYLGTEQINLSIQIKEI